MSIGGQIVRLSFVMMIAAIIFLTHTLWVVGSLFGSLMMLILGCGACEVPLLDACWFCG